jgi:hypothetical protein
MQTVEMVAGENVVDEFPRSREPAVRALLDIPLPFPVGGETPAEDPASATATVSYRRVAERRGC